MDIKKLLITLLVIVVVWKFYSNSDEVSLGPGVKVYELPYQGIINLPFKRAMGDYTITGLAQFKIKAKVLSKENYSFDRASDFSPTDLALGWGNMSDEDILDKIDISQSGRFYRWRVDSFPIPRKEIETYSANMHLIPANKSVAYDLKRVRKGEIIELSGSLVEVTSDIDSSRWKSSLTRNDTGAGACELILVESIYVVSP
jgi:hypothetical protein